MEALRGNHMRPDLNCAIHILSYIILTFLMLRFSSWVGLGALTVERSFFPENECSFPRTNGTIKNDPIVPKKNECLEHVLKNIETISKRTERNGKCLKRTVKIVNAFLFSRTRSKLRTHFKSVMCFSSDFLCM